MLMRRAARVLLFLVPGLTVAAGVIGWGVFLAPPRYRVPGWAETWSEPKHPPGVFGSWRSEGDFVVGETEPWPHKHPRANSYLTGIAIHEGDVEVALRVRFRAGRFPMSRYLGCYLCYDPEAGNGYWLSTGHGVGKYPGQAYIKEVHAHKWETKARSPLEITSGEEYALVFRRFGDRLALDVDGATVVEWRNSEFTRGRVQLRLHNTEVEIHQLTVRGNIAPNDR